MVHDVFICHASEDKDAVARPLAKALEARGLTVWLDEFQIKLGDSTDGGQTWKSGILPGYEDWMDTTDPVVTFGSEGNLYALVLPFNFVIEPSGDHNWDIGHVSPEGLNDAIYLSRSLKSDGPVGQKWQPPVLLAVGARRLRGSCGLARAVPRPQAHGRKGTLVSRSRPWQTRSAAPSGRPLPPRWLLRRSEPVVTTEDEHRDGSDNRGVGRRTDPDAV